MPEWSWAPHKDAWKFGYERLKEYVEREGNAIVAQSYKTEDSFGLGSWVLSKRNYFKKNKLSNYQIKALEALPGWSWDPYEDAWKFGYERLKEYVEREGNAIVAQSYNTDEGFALGVWVSNQRNAYKNKKLSDDQIGALEALPNWSWNLLEDAWNLAYEQLKKYAEKKGHAKVPVSFISENGSRLGVWVKAQRRYYKKNRLPDDRIRLLEEIGFVWQIKKN